MKQIRDSFNRSEATILQLIRENNFPARKIGGIWESDTDEIDRWRKQQIRGVDVDDDGMKRSSGVAA